MSSARSIYIFCGRIGIAIGVMAGIGTGIGIAKLTYDNLYRGGKASSCRKEEDHFHQNMIAYLDHVFGKAPTQNHTTGGIMIGGHAIVREGVSFLSKKLEWR